MFSSSLYTMINNWTCLHPSPCKALCAASRVHDSHKTKGVVLSPSHLHLLNLTERFLPRGPVLPRWHAKEIICLFPSLGRLMVNKPAQEQRTGWCPKKTKTALDGTELHWSFLHNKALTASSCLRPISLSSPTGVSYLLTPQRSSTHWSSRKGLVFLVTYHPLARRHGECTLPIVLPWGWDSIEPLFFPCGPFTSTQTLNQRDI